MTKKQRMDRKSAMKVVSGLVTVLLICSLLLCFTVVVQVLSQGYASFGGYSFFRVVTGSMEPTIPLGSLMVSHTVDINTLEVGDIICFRSISPDMAGRCITHRVVGITELPNGEICLQTKGDYNVVADAHYVTEDNLIGKVLWWTSGSNFFSDLLAFFSTKISFLTCVAFPALVISGILLRNSVRTIRKELAEARRELSGIQSKEESTDVSHHEGGITDGTESALSSVTQPQDPEKGAKSVGPPDNKTAETNINADEYHEMCAKIRAELFEEFKQGYDREQSK